MVMHYSNTNNPVDFPQEEQEYDPVIDALQSKIDAMWKLTQGNMNMGMMNIMDDIRLEQIDQLREAIKIWQVHVGAKLMSDKGYQESTHEKQAEFAKKRNSI